MSLCPFATVKLLPESSTQPVIAPRIAILHSAAGRGSLYRFFRDSSNLESHFWVAEDGRIEQYVDTNRRADANLHANGYAVSIETESSPSATERWNPVQAAAIVKLLDWLCTEHPNIKRHQCDSPTGSGIGWHIMFGTPGPWTPVAKSCPGPARIAQARDEIIPAVAAPVKPSGWQPPPFPSNITSTSPAQRVAVWRMVLGDLGYRGFKVGMFPWSMTLGAATRRFQRRHGLKPDGVVGPKTWAVAMLLLKKLKAKA